MVWQKKANSRFGRKGVNIRFDKGCKFKDKGCEYINCNGVPPLHDNLLRVNIKYEYCVRTNTIFSQYYPNR